MNFFRSIANMPHRLRRAVGTAASHVSLTVTAVLALTLLPTFVTAGAPTTQPISGGDDEPLIFHLPGIGGHRFPDVMLTQGLVAGGLNGEVYIYDWTGVDEGLNALTNEARHVDQAGIVAKMIETVTRRQPHRRIVLTCHSGGAGVAAWALRLLPDDVQVDTWLMIAPALSPEFDLSASLRHVAGHAYTFNSGRDAVLGFGTRNFGTIDRVNTDAAGRIGFAQPATADATQYQKLVQIDYNPGWLRLANAGDHIGATMRPFVRGVVAPLLLTGRLPVEIAATQPARESPATQSAR